MRIELGGAFADLLNEQGKGSGDNEMRYVERTLGFRTRKLEDRDLRLVFLSLITFSIQINQENWSFKYWMTRNIKYFHIGVDIKIVL